MKILIVNAYLCSKHGEQFKEFETIIKQIFLTQRELMDTETEFFICDNSNIDDFLYQISAMNNNNKEAARIFDVMDMIFIEGDANLRPWSKKAQKLMNFLVNCVKSNKILWASSFGMQALVYLLSSNIEKSVNIVNGLNGSTLKNIESINKNVDKLAHYDYFLDNVSGDLYQYAHDADEWQPVANVGMHYRKIAQENPIPGKIIMKTEEFRVNSRHQQIYSVFEGKKNETICYIKKIFMQHWGLIGCDPEFLVPSKNSWDLHPIIFPNPQRSFTILGETKYTPQIIEINKYCFATLFNVSKKYQETIKILRNFILTQLKNIRIGYFAIPIVQASLKSIGVTIDDGEIQFKKKDKQGNSSSELCGITKKVTNTQKKEEQHEKNTKTNLATQVNCFHQTGFSTMKRLSSQGLLQNANKHIEYEADGHRADSAKKRTIEMQQNDDEIIFQQQGFRKPIKGLGNSNSVQTYENILQDDAFEANNNNTIPKFGGIQQLVRPMTAITCKSAKTISDLKSLHFNFSQNNNRIQSGKSACTVIGVKNNLVDQSNNANNKRFNISQQLNIESPSGQINFSKNQAEIRQLLHPRIQDEGLPSKETLWVPGFYSCKNVGLSGQIQQNGLQSNKAIRIPSANSSKRRLFSGTKKNFFEQQNNSKQEDPEQVINTKSTIRNIQDYDQCREKPIIRTSGPYYTDEEKRKIEELQASKKNLGDPFFHTGIPKPNFIENYISKGEYVRPASNHQFRSVEKSKWITNNNFYP